MSRPHVTLKLATSLDGRIATASGESRWITGPAARAEVQRLRAEVGAIMVGAGTARADDPELLARTEPPPKRRALRVVLDTHLSLTPGRRLLSTIDQAPLLILHGDVFEAERRPALLAAGARLAQVPNSPASVDLDGALALLESEGVGRVLVEGGGRLAAALIKADLVDRLEWMRAPLVIGEEGVPALGGLGLVRLSEAPAFRRVALRELGPDLWESYERA